mmetsp:Transcript_16548/g.24010  ORF Transcript_16548/g.24010 Transcript_16548/m.24010 type:complete len:170 (-) Transcript_16548:88-597(-)
MHCQPSAEASRQEISEAQKMGGSVCRRHGHFSRQYVSQLDILDSSKRVETDCLRLSNMLSFIFSKGGRESRPRRQSESSMRQRNEVGFRLITGVPQSRLSSSSKGNPVWWGPWSLPRRFNITTTKARPISYLGSSLLNYAPFSNGAILQQSWELVCCSYHPHCYYYYYG